MNVKNKPVRNIHLKAQLKKELSFIKNLFTRFSLPLQKKGENDDQMDIEITNTTKQDEEKQLPKRAQSIIELEEKLEKIKSQNNFNLKTKLAKKSLTSKLNKKIKKRERVKLNKHKVKAALDSSEIKDVKEIKEKKIKHKEKNVNTPKPIFNNEGKLVFSKFDFAKLGENVRGDRSHKDPRKLLENLKHQEEKLQRLAEVDSEKAKELKEKAAWKNILQKAEGEKVKDDPTLLKKSIKKMEQKKKVSQKKWEGRIQNVEKKKEERQIKRKENISKKKKEKKAKVVKAAVKRGRVVI